MRNMLLFPPDHLRAVVLQQACGDLTHMLGGEYPGQEDVIGTSSVHLQGL